MEREKRQDTKDFCLVLSVPIVLCLLFIFIFFIMLLTFHLEPARLSIYIKSRGLVSHATHTAALRKTQPTKADIRKLCLNRKLLLILQTHVPIRLTQYSFTATTYLYGHLFPNILFVYYLTLVWLLKDFLVHLTLQPESDAHLFHKQTSIE